MDSKSKIGDIVASDYKAASVFRKYGIDFCCGGGKMLEMACATKGISVQKVLSDLIAIEKDSPSSENSYKDWSLNKLIDHIIVNHHAYTRKTISDLHQYLTKTAQVHGDHNPELISILRIFRLLEEELTNHMQKEEMVLFPYIREMELSKENNSELPSSSFGAVQNPITMMENEHDVAGNWIKEIRELSNDFTPPKHACNTYMVSYRLLEEFEKDLHKHIHLENNILFPGAINMEKNNLIPNS